MRSTHPDVSPMALRWVAGLTALGLGAASCTSHAVADSEPREIEIVTSFDRTESSLDASGERGDGEELELPLVEESRRQSTQPTAILTTTTSMAPIETTVPGTTIAPVPKVWKVGLLNQEGGDSGSFPEFGVGVESAVAWANGQGHVEGDREIQLLTCVSSGAASSADCAGTLLASGVDTIVHGFDTYSASSIPVLDGGGAPVLAGVALSVNDVRATNAALTIGGEPTEFAGLAAAVVARGFGASAIIHDDTADALALVDQFIIPVLDAAGITHIKVAVPLGTVDATGALTPAAASDSDSWIVAVSTPLCQPVIVGRSDFAVTATAFYTSACTGEDILAAFGSFMEQSFFTAELVTPLWFGVVPRDLRENWSLAATVIAKLDPELADNPTAIMGYVAALTVIDQLRRGGPSLESAQALPVPHPLAMGELDCGQSPTWPAVCSADVMLAQYFGGSLVAPPELVNGIRGR